MTFSKKIPSFFAVNALNTKFALFLYGTIFKKVGEWMHLSVVVGGID